jgi:hypothetical protein
MSNHDHTLPDTAYEEGVSLKKIIAVGIASLVSFAICSVAAWAILRKMNDDYAQAGVVPEATKIGQDEIGIVDHVPFDGDTRLARYRADNARKLGSYGWVDRKKGTIRIPIERAMQQVVEQAGGAAPATGGAR